MMNTMKKLFFAIFFFSVIIFQTLPSFNETTTYELPDKVIDDIYFL